MVTTVDEKPKRSPALLATVVAVPIAILVGLAYFWLVKPDAPPPRQQPVQAATMPTAEVELAAPPLTERAATVCRALMSQLPSKIRDLPARKVSQGPEQNAAFGEPPLTVACGVPALTMCEKPGGGQGCVPLEADVLIMDNVCWFGETGPAGALFTTMDREIPVRVTVPMSFQQPGQWANEFSDTLVKTVRSKTAGVPSGCR